MSFTFSTLVSMIIINAVFVLALYQMIRTSMINYFNIDLFLLASLAILIRFLLPFEFPFTISVPVKWGFFFLYDFFVMMEVNIGGYTVNFFDFFTLAWLIGILIYGYCFYKHSVTFRYYYLIRSHRAGSDAKISAILNEIALSHPKSKAKFRVYITNMCVTPFVYGIRHPVIILPEAIPSEEELYYILCHETAHYYNHHMLYKFLCSMLGVIYFWNPLVRIFRKEINRILEISVDAKVVAPLTPEDRLGYSQSLTTMARTLAKEKSSPSFIASYNAEEESEASKAPKASRSARFFKISKAPSSLSQRVQLIVNSPAKFKTLTPNGFVSALLLVAALTISLFFVFEPYRISDKYAEETFNSDSRSLYYIANSDGTFSLYLDDRLLVTEDEVSDSKVPVYDSSPNQ